MKLVLKRRYLGEAYTIGSLFVDGEYLCDTIEDKVRDYNKDGDLLDAGEKKVFGKTAIPFGSYKIHLSMSPKFQRLLPILENVRHFTYIRIHSGTHAGHSHGCILPGENKVKGKVLNSKKWEMKIVELMHEAEKRQEIITIDIE